MRSLYSLAFAASLLLACAPDQPASKYPFPPQFVSPAEVPPTMLTAPPAKGTAAFEAAIQTIIKKQRTLTAAEIADIKSQITIAPEVIVQPVLGAKYTPEQYPALYTLLKHAASDAWRIADEDREYWKSPRPWYSDKRVVLHTEPIKTYGFPSGHTTTFGTWAYVLTDLIPEKRDAWFARAWSVGGNRMAGGAHFPFDVEGGKKLAGLVHAEMETSPAYIREYNAAALELNRPGKADLRPPVSPYVPQPASPRI